MPHVQQASTFFTKHFLTMLNCQCRQKIAGVVFWCSIKATFHLTISLCGQRATGKIQRDKGLFPLGEIFRAERHFVSFKATFHLTISMRGQRATGKIQRNNYHQGSCRPLLTGKTMSVFLIFTQGTHRNVKNRRVRSSL